MLRISTIENIPPELRALPQWLLWRYKSLPDGRKTKRPIRADNGMYASSTDRDTWCELSIALNSKIKADGIGFAVTAEDPYTGVDLDHCINKQTGEINPLAEEIVARLNSYTEVTPSGEGLRVWVKGQLPNNGNRKKWGDLEVEMYDRGRYFTVTGLLWMNSPPTIEARQAELDDLHAKIWGAPKDSKQQALGPTNCYLLSDQEVIERASNARNGHRFASVFAGNIAEFGNDHSRADQALCNHLAFWTGGNAEQMDRIFRQSGLMRDKWDRADYSSQTIQKAIQDTPNRYTPRVPIESQGALEQMEDLPRTDLGNAERLVRTYGNNMRWWDDRQAWYIWDGRRWQEDRTLRVYAWAKDTIRAIYREAERHSDSTQRQDTAKWAMRSEAQSKIRAAVELARSEHGIPIKAGCMDGESTLWMINLHNGTVDLKTGKFRPHRREDFISRLSNVRYDPKATCPTWIAFLERACDGNQDLMQYLARVVGYCLTGSVREKAVFIVWGGNDTGKSTFIETIRAMLGDYSGNLRPESIMVRRNEIVPHDIAKLEGTRLVTVGETEEGQRMATALVKRFSGGDMMAARFLYDRREHEFKPTFKLFVGTNHKPVIRDDSAWNRIRLIPFCVSIPKHEQDKELRQKLLAELPGIFNWALNGCNDWLAKNSLAEPTRVLQASEDYRREMDPLEGFFEECCELDPKAWTSTQDLRQAYQSWAESNGTNPVNINVFTERLRNLGCFSESRKQNGQKQRGWVGILLQRGTPGTPGYADSINYSIYNTHARIYGNGVPGVPRCTPGEKDHGKDWQDF